MTAKAPYGSLPTEKSPLLVEQHPEQTSKTPKRSFNSRVFVRGLVAFAATLTVLYILPDFADEPSKHHEHHKHHKAETCLTPACIHASSEILYNLSPKYQEINPCTDFEQLVCGGWQDRHDLRPDQGDAFTGTIMSENSQMLLRHILEAPYPKDSRVWYRTCLC